MFKTLEENHSKCRDNGEYSCWLWNFSNINLIYYNDTWIIEWHMYLRLLESRNYMYERYYLDANYNCCSILIGISIFLLHHQIYIYIYIYIVKTRGVLDISQKKNLIPSINGFQCLLLPGVIWVASSSQSSTE